MTAKPDEQDPSMDDILASIRRIMLDEQARLKDGSGPAEEPDAGQDEPEPAVLVLDESMVVGEPAPPEPAGTAAVVGESLPFRTLEVQPVAVEAPVSHAPVSEGPVILEPPAVAPVAREAIESPVAPITLSPTAPSPITSSPITSSPITSSPITSSPILPNAQPTAAAEAPAPNPLGTLDAQAIEALLAPAAAAAAAASVEALLAQMQAERASLMQPVPAISGPTLEDVVRSELRPILKAWLDENLPGMVERLVRAELARLTLRHGV